jgi:hypothetical protein
MDGSGRQMVYPATSVATGIAPVSKWTVLDVARSAVESEANWNCTVPLAPANAVSTVMTR